MARRATGVPGAEQSGAKRKLSTSAVVKDQPKRSKANEEQVSPKKEVESKAVLKQQPDAVAAVPPKSPKKVAEAGDPNAQKSNGASSDEEGEIDDDELDGDGDDDDDRAGQDRRVVDYGPRTFYIWQEAVSSLLEDVEDRVFLVRKKQLDATYPRITALKGAEEDKEEEIEEIVDEIEKLVVDVEEKAQRTKEAKQMAKIWNEVTKKGDWWFEITLQGKKPEAGVPATEVTMEGYVDDGEVVPDEEKKKRFNELSTWWVTGVAVPNEESLKAINLISDNVWDGRYPGSP